jgi:signal transduction histidine kinase/CheY-like chemotaxis protein/HAMP domain-containing protein
MTDTLATFADQVTTVAREVGVEGKLGGQAKVPGASGTWKDLTENVNQLAANLTTQVRAIAEVATAVTQGDLTRSITVEARGEVAALKDTTNEMIRNLRDTTRKNTDQDWLKTNLAKFSRMLQGQKDLNTVARLILSELAPVVAAQHGLFYVMSAPADSPRLTLVASYGARGQSALGGTLELGEGLVGQCAIEKSKILLANVPLDYVRIHSGLGAATPQNIFVLPIVFEGQVKGVLELASFERFSPTHEQFLDQLTESIGIVLNTIEANMRTEDLLAQSQSLARELQSRQQELTQTNQELEEKAGLLAHQNQEVERKNMEVEQARQALEEKAAQLALTSKYKSEFLANMSHELRTPLNSLLILSDQLSKNPTGNLTGRETEYAKTIHSSGNDLLNLINDILDLSKIESGTVVVDVSEVRFAELHNVVDRMFTHVAESKGLAFRVQLSTELPRSIQTDAKRLQQVLKNLLSNAFKFTRQGAVSLEIHPADPNTRFENEALRGRESVVAFSVSDTGIGIPFEKQQIIFEAFQQADGSTNRKFGGTGLGLAISRELSWLLGGEIHLESAPGEGSRFTLYLPAGAAPPVPARRPALAVSAGGALPPAQAVAPRAPEAVELIDEAGDDRESIGPDDRVLLVVEYDLSFARMVADAAHDHGFKAVITGFGAAALSLVEQYAPCAVTLDISLPDLSGWRVLERLKHSSKTRHIPVFVITTDESRERGLRAGAVGVAQKPIQTREGLDDVLRTLTQHQARAERDLLLVEANPARRAELRELLESPLVRVREASSGADALQQFAARVPDALVVDPAIPDMELTAWVEGLESIADLSDLPVLVHAGKALNETQAGALKRLAKSGRLREVQRPERLLDVAALVLHQRLEDLNDAQRRRITTLHDGDATLSGRKVLIVDDDIRNIFALTSVLEQHGMTTLSAETGRDAIAQLETTPDIEVVLMDVMMPEMDGLDTTRAIRRIATFRDLPIIAVTAKAMKGDREKCIEAGAWDYLSKPVDPDELLAMLRAWLVR